MRRRAYIGAGIAGLVVFCGVLALTLMQLHRPATPADPFTAKTLASVKFPLYYPTKLPNGFKIDSKSITSPQEGVVVLHATDDKGRKIYMSQEARSKTYNYGGFFKGIEQSKSFTAHEGEAVTGYLYNRKTVIASLVTAKSWIIVNTQDTSLAPGDLKLVVANMSRSR